jgi:putative oxidoreductase
MRVLTKVGMVALWVVQVLAAAAFVAIGVAKFASPVWARNFARWGYPDGFYMVVGALEIAGGLLLLAPKATSYGAALNGMILVAAAATLRRNDLPMSPPLVWLVVMILLGVARRRRAWRPGASRLPVTPARRSLSEGGADQV